MNAPDRIMPEDRVIEADLGAVRAILTLAPPDAELGQALTRAASAPGIGAVALFLSQPGSEDQAAPAFAALQALERPVVAGLSGAVSGPALALALAADHALCSPGTVFSVTEVRLGLVPRFGLSQALPRRLGAAEALRLMLTGQAIDAAEAVALGLVDEVVEGDLADAAIARAADLAFRPRPARPDPGLRDPLAFQAAVAAARRALASERLPAPARIVDCVEAALLLPPDQGLDFEAATREDLEATEEAAGLSHAARVERLLQAPVPVPDAPPLTGVAIWGTGGASAALVRRALSAGLRVALCAPAQQDLVPALEATARAQEAEVAAGRLTPEARDSDWARLTPWLEPVAEDAVILCPGAPDWLPRATRLSVLALDAGAGADDRLSALSFAMPGEAGLMPGRLAEIRLAPGRDRQAAPALALLRRLGLQAVLTGQGGPVALRLRAALAAAIAELEGEGRPRTVIAAALAAEGMIGGRALPPTAPRPEDHAAILARCEAAMANAGARLVQSGAAASPDLVDAVALAAGLYPRWMGGPMFRADRRGLMVLRRDLMARAAIAPQIWAPAALIDRLVSEGRGFADLGRLRTG